MMPKKVAEIKKKILKDRTLIKQAENVEFVTNKYIQQ